MNRAILLGCSSPAEHVSGSVAQQLAVTPLDVATAGTSAGATVYDAKSEVNFQFTVPADVSLSSLALSAGAVSLGDRAQILKPNSTWATVSGTNSELQVGVGTQIGNLISVGGAFLANTAHVHGDLRVGSVVVGCRPASCLGRRARQGIRRTQNSELCLFADQVWRNAADAGRSVRPGQCRSAATSGLQLPANWRMERRLGWQPDIFSHCQRAKG